MLKKIVKPLLLVPKLGSQAMDLLLSRLPEEVRTGWEIMKLAEFFAEPPIHDNKGDNNNVNEWGQRAYIRLLAAGSGSVALRPDGIKEGSAEDLLYMRLDEARFPIVPHLDLVESVSRETWTTKPMLDEVECTGALFPKIVIVNEKCKVRGAGEGLSRRNFWLLKALRQHGYDELNVLLVNAETSERRPNEGIAKIYAATARFQPLWVGIGPAVSYYLDDLKVPHLKTSGAAYYLRVASRDGVGGYATLFKEANLPSGAYWDRNISGISEKDGSISLDMSPSYWAAVNADLIKTKTIQLPNLPINTLTRERLEKARRLYVLEAKSLQDVAKECGVRIDKVNEAYEADGWEAERAKVVEKNREKAYEDAGRVIAKAAASAQKMTWGSFTMGLNSIVTRQQDKSLILSPADTIRMGQMAMEMTNFVPPQSEAEVDRLRAMTLPELVNSMNDRLRGMFGELPGMQGKNGPPAQIEGEMVSSNPGNEPTREADTAAVREDGELEEEKT